MTSKLLEQGKMTSKEDYLKNWGSVSLDLLSKFGVIDQVEKDLTTCFRQIKILRNARNSALRL